MHPIFEADFVAVGCDLPDAGEARLHGKTPALPDLVFFDFGGDRRAGTDQAHFTFEHVDKLGQFVQGFEPISFTSLFAGISNTGIRSHSSGRSTCLTIGSI